MPIEDPKKARYYQVTSDPNAHVGEEQDDGCFEVNGAVSLAHKTAHLLEGNH